MPITSRSLIQSTILFMLAGLVALLAIVGTVMWLAERASDYSAAVADPREVRTIFADLRSLLQDAETGQRGFLLTGDPGYLEPLTNARAAIPAKLRQAESYAQRFPTIRGSVTELTGLIAQKMSEIDQTISLANTGRRQEADALVRTNVGRTLMDRLRVITTDVIQRADVGFDRRVAQLQDSIATLWWVTLVGAAVIVVVVSAGAWTVWRYTRDLLAAQKEINALNSGLEEKVRERTSDLGRANDEIQRFAYIVTHDLRAPLVNIMGFTSELEASLAPIQALVHEIDAKAEDAAGNGAAPPPLAALADARASATEDLPEAITFIRSSTRKMDGLINAILKLSREGRRPLKPEPIALRPLLQASVDAIHHQVAEADGKVDLDIQVPNIVSDRLALEQAIGNLLDNAVKYRQPDRALHLRIRAKPSVANRVLIEVEDNGRGIASQDHERVFELFRRSGSQDKQGEGIGLAHVRSAIRNLGGDITLTSTLGTGTTFTITMPRNLADVRGSSVA